MEPPKLEAVLPRARAGDTEAFANLYHAFRRRVVGLCRNLLGSPEEAEDAAQEVFLRAQRAMSSYNTALPFSRWLLGIAANHCVDLLRRRRVETRLFAAEEASSSDLPALTPSPLSAALTEEKRRAVRIAVDSLSERHRVPLTLRYYADLSYEEIGTVLGLPHGQVATLLFRAKKELRRILTSAGKENWT